MWRDVSLSYEGALQILGHHDRPRLEQLSRLLGGGILASGVAALAVSAPAPAAVFGAVWGWVDQKNEATSLLRAIIDCVSDRILALRGYERHELLKAAHTTIVASSFFEVLSEEAPDLRLLDEEREMLINGEWREHGESLFSFLYKSEVPIPSATQGFYENLELVRSWLARLTLNTLTFFRPLYKRQALPDPNALQKKALKRYQTRYLGLATTVPEFLIWTSLSEHAATRHAVTGIQAELQEAFQRQGTALERMERLLSLGLTRRGFGGRDDVAAVVARANRSRLSQPVTSNRNIGTLTIPSVEEIYVSPHCRFASYHRDDSHPSSEEWWSGQRLISDLDLLLTAHLTSPEAFQRPLLLLGHPGAGKSLLTKVLAARLPPAAYTVVRVPLRRVNADAEILDQIQAALDFRTNRRVQWWEVAQANPQALRVVLLDGLDEMIQAASGGQDRRGYLQEIMNFQRTEAEQNHPVAVIVTSRTVVADRVLIADGTPIIKLEDFNDQQVAEWLNRWNKVNEISTTAGLTRALTFDSVNNRQEIVKQPLLLLMIALYAADPAAPPLDSILSTSALYRLLLNEFARREAEKPKPPNRLSEKAVAEAAKKHLWRLTVAAFAMVNRGRQDITDAELGADLLALDESISSGVADTAQLGRDLVGRFFFVHQAEARTGNDDSVRRCYEFLHATFGEYLVAEHIVDRLSRLAAMRSLNDGPVDDGFLYALLSHQPLSDRRQILTFAAELFCELPDADQEEIIGLVEELASTVKRRRDTGHYASYRPTPPNQVRHLAAYSLNLVLLRVLMPAEARVEISALCEEADDPKLAWRSIVALWTAGLDPEELDGVGTVLMQRDGFLEKTNRGSAEAIRDVVLARLAGDEMLERRLRFGLGIHDQTIYTENDDPWDHAMAAWLIPAMFSHGGAFSYIISAPKPGTPDEAVARVARLADMLLVLHGHQMEAEDLKNVLDWRLRLSAYLPPNPTVLASTLLADPDQELVAKILPLLDTNDHPHVTALLSLAAQLTSSSEVNRKLSRAAGLPQSPSRMTSSQLEVLHHIIQSFRWPDNGCLPEGVEQHEYTTVNLG